MERRSLSMPPNALAFSCPRWGRAFISRESFQNAYDLVERRERRGSTATPCWAQRIARAMPSLMVLTTFLHDRLLGVLGLDLAIQIPAQHRRQHGCAGPQHIQR